MYFIVQTRKNCTLKQDTGWQRSNKRAER